MRSISTSEQRAFATKREQHLRQQEQDRNNSEKAHAKRIQQQTGCTWGEAIRAVVGSAS